MPFEQAAERLFDGFSVRHVPEHSSPPPLRRLRSSSIDSCSKGDHEFGSPSISVHQTSRFCKLLGRLS
jgi:hypothetical protein